ncbi:MAG TPA: hypothetical protein VGO48_00575 [Conexibacter sp.]|jgi:hypothetical protein|nr:hypothetical protein [Conexibacter sp.]
MADSGRTRAASAETLENPLAGVFSTLSGFGDVRGAGMATEYLTARTGKPGTSGWEAHAITPPQEALSFRAAAQNVDPLYELFSADLSKGLFRAWTALDDTPNVATAQNLYLRSDIRDPSAGAYQLVTDSVTPLPPQSIGSRRPWLAGASSDLSHVLFESRLNFAADARGGNMKLYKSDDGVVRLMKANAACAGGSGATQPCSMAGIGAVFFSSGHYTPHVISDDGSRVNFTSPFGTPGSPSTQAGVVSKLFQLDDSGTAATADDAMVQLSMSEKALPDDARAAIYSTASTDGRRVFFMSDEQSTDTAGSGLYMWERQPTNEAQTLAVDAAGGTFTLTAHTQPTRGSGTLTNGATTVADVIGSFTVGQTVAGVGIPVGTTVAAVGSDGTITLSNSATTDGAEDLTASIEQTTPPLAWNATTANVQAALQGLSILGRGNVAVSDGPGGTAPYTIEFAGGLAGVNVMELTTDPSGLSGGARTATVATTNDIHNLTLIGDGATGVLGSSDDGHRVYFARGDEIWLWQDVVASPGRGLFLVARLFSGDMQFLTPGAGVYWNFSRQPLSRVAPDGRSLLFEASSGAGLPPGYQHGSCPNGNENASLSGLCSEAYIYRTDASTPSTPAIVCASCNLAAPAVPGQTFLNARRGAGASLTASHLARALADDGRRAFFNTDEALVPEDTNGAVDVYAYDVLSRQAHLISSGTDPADSYFMDASADGNDVFFATRAQLVGWDADQAYDLYDARVGGGFPEPPAAVAGCSGDACQGPASSTPGAAAIGSSAFRGLGDLTPRLGRHRAPHKCARSQVKKRVAGKTRCVKRPHRARRRARRTTRSRNARNGKGTGR